MQHAADAPRRILVVGTAGCGKTTLARSLSSRLGLPRVELDDLRYGPQWRPVPDGAFVQAVGEAAAGDRWIIDGNYAAVRDLLWDRADLVVWMDLPLRVVLRRLVGRTVRRLLSGEQLANGNRERLGRLIGPRSIIVWAIRSHAPLREEYARKTADARRAGLCVVRLRSAGEERAWLAGLREGRDPSPA